MTYNFYLGLVRNPEHEQKLIELAVWLDQNKFSTTLSIINGRAQIDVSPHSETPMSEDEFKFYAAELLIHALVKRLGES